MRYSQGIILQATLIFLTIVDIVLTKSGLIQPLNSSLSTAFYSLNSQWLTTPMVVLTYLGSDAVLVSVGFITLLFLLKQNHKQTVLVLFLAILTAFIIWFIAKATMQMPRPNIINPPYPLQPIVGFGYPSGHTLKSVVILGLGSLILSKFLGTHKVLLFLFASLIILGISLSRVYLGFHWANDVIGGLLFGSIIVLAFYSKLDRKF